MKLRQVKWLLDEVKVLRAGPSVQVCPIRCAKIRWKDKRFSSILLAAYDQRLLFSHVSLQSSVLPLQNCPPFICGKLWIILAARSVCSAFLLLLKEHVK